MVTKTKTNNQNNTIDVDAIIQVNIIFENLCKNIILLLIL